MIKLKKDERIDWFQVMIDLNRKGFTIARISRHVGIPKSTIFAWKNHYARPRFEDALLVIELWCDKTGKTPADIPISNQYNF